MKELRETEVLINRYLKEQGFERIETSIPNIEEKIRELEEEIAGILSTEPYIYKDLLDDEEQVEAIKKKLRAEVAEYEDYKQRLSKALETMLEGGEVDWQSIMK